MCVQLRVVLSIEKITIKKLLSNVQNIWIINMSREENQFYGIFFLGLLLSCVPNFCLKSLLWKLRTGVYTHDQRTYSN